MCHHMRLSMANSATPHCACEFFRKPGWRSMAVWLLTPAAVSWWACEACSLTAAQPAQRQCLPVHAAPLPSLHTRAASGPASTEQHSTSVQLQHTLIA